MSNGFRVEVMSPYCGACASFKIKYQNKSIRCRKCKNGIYLKKHIADDGEIYYTADEPFGLKWLNKEYEDMFKE